MCIAPMRLFQIGVQRGTSRLANAQILADSQREARVAILQAIGVRSDLVVRFGFKVEMLVRLSSSQAKLHRWLVVRVGFHFVFDRSRRRVFAIILADHVHFAVRGGLSVSVDRSVDSELVWLANLVIFKTKKNSQINNLTGRSTRRHLRRWSCRSSAHRRRSSSCRS